MTCTAPGGPSSSAILYASRLHLIADHSFQPRQPLLQIVNLLRLRLDDLGLCFGAAILLLHLVQQHRGDVLIADRVGLAVVVIGDQFRIDLRYR